MKNLLLAFILIFSLSSCVETTTSSQNTGNGKQENQRLTYNNTNIATGNLSYKIPGSWLRQKPSSPMRVDEFVVDPTTQTIMKVFFFPGMSDQVEMNLERWKKQFAAGAVEDTFTQFNYNNIPMTVFKMTGTFLKSSKMGDPKAEKTELENHTMYAVIAETSDGTWFFKLTAPSDFVERQKPKLRKFIYSFKLVN